MDTTHFSKMIELSLKIEAKLHLMSLMKGTIAFLPHQGTEVGQLLLVKTQCVGGS